MVDRRHAQEFLSRLPRDDPFRTLEEISFWLKALRGAYGISPQRTFEVVDVLDATARTPQRSLTSDFIALGSRYQKYQGQRVWNASFQFSRELGATYEHLVHQYRQHAAGSDLLLPALPAIVSRAIRALRSELKWSLLRQGPIDQMIWKLAGALYGYAEENNFATESVRVYQDTRELSSVQLEYLQALMLGVSATDTLPPESVHLVEFLVEHCAEFFALERAPKRGCQYYSDTLSGKPPARLIERVAPASGIRYFGPDKASTKVHRLIATISERGMVPPELNPGGAHKPDSILDVLDHLVRYWGPTPPTRASERQAALTRISVVHNFDSILAMVSGHSQELDFDSDVEIWSVENESQGGYGALVTETASEWVEIGSLLGIREEEGASWGIGIVRRLSKPAAGSINVGIETLSRGVVKVGVTSSKASRRELNAQALLLLSSREGSAHAGELMLMLPPGAFAIGRNLVMHAFDRTYLLVPKELHESGNGYELGRFRLQSERV